jgi:glycosyltransferase involved in cell wall biosynthesis
MDKLYICIPAYNEEANIREVARSWHEVVERIGIDSKLVIIDDGSKDDTYKILTELTKDLPQLVAITKPNSGHGATVLYGYHYALENNADYIFQTDSDGQTLPDEFWQFWEQREQHSAIIGHRNRREDGTSRVFVTKTLKFVLQCIFHLNIPDANTPFRLMNAEVLRKHIDRIPADFNLSNIMLTVCLVKYGENILFISITFRPRQGGVNSINFRKIVKIGARAVRDFKRIKTELDV